MMTISEILNVIASRVGVVSRGKNLSKRERKILEVVVSDLTNLSIELISFSVSIPECEDPVDDEEEWDND